MRQRRMIAAIIQARMGSARLPGKVLREIAGKPMLWHLINRISRSKYIEKIIIAATVDGKDDAIERYAKDHNVAFYRGRVDDIVDRYYQAAKNYNIDVIVRVWGDCPLIDSEIVDATIEKFLGSNADYANNSNPPSYPKGMNIEIYSIHTLEKIWKETNDPFFREYPFEYIKAHSASFSTAYVENDVDLSEFHWTVDYIEDLKLVEKVFKELYREKNNFGMKSILNLMEKYPDLRVMNKGLERNIEYQRDLEMRKKALLH